MRKTKKSKFKTDKVGQKFGQWTLTKFINRGGNGEVWEAISETSPAQRVALKLLVKVDDEGYKRFRAEVDVVKRNSDVPGLLQILDFFLPEKTSQSTPWYAMPLAKSLQNDLKPEQAIGVALSVSQILIELHSRGISHRDVKPANILIKDGEIHLSDFGLVKFKKRQRITPKRGAVGPKNILPPEMRRNPAAADGKAVDVYLIAKTLWMLLTGDKDGFDGQYQPGTCLEVKRFVPSIYHTPIDNLLSRCTDNDPSLRPNIEAVVAELKNWKTLNRDYELRSKSQWLDIQSALFSSTMPKTVVWENIGDIITVLSIISEHDQANHTMLPTGGGCDLEAAKLANEDGCIELCLDRNAYILKPAKLIFESFAGDLDWSYFRLETKRLERVDDSVNSSAYEELTEILPNSYSSYECYKFNDFNGKPLPSSARPITRILEGALMICLKTGTYNSIPETYDGLHNKVDGSELRRQIENMIEIVNRPILLPTITRNNHIDSMEPVFIKSSIRKRGARILSEIEVGLMNKVIDLFRSAKAESERIKAELGLDDSVISYFDDAATEIRWQYNKSPKPNLEEFQNFLDSLSDEEVKLVHAVMYGGRDVRAHGRAHTLDEMLGSIQRTERKTLLFSILEKTSLEEYLLSGIGEYK